MANSPSPENKLMKESEVDAKIKALDVDPVTTTPAERISSIKEVDGKIVVEKGSI